MNWRVIRLALLVMLVILNIGLFTYNTAVERERYVVPKERIERIQEQYRKKGYILEGTIPRDQYPIQRLVLEKENLEERADGFWNEEYEKSYMIGSKILYTCGSEVLTIDRASGRLHYEQNEPIYEKTVDEERDERLAYTFARILMDAEELKPILKQKERGRVIYTYCEVYDENLVFCNGIDVTMYRGAVVEADMQQYRIQGYDEEERNRYPIDEVLYACQDLWPAKGGSEVLYLYCGYGLREEGESVYGEPQVLLSNEHGERMLVNQYHVTFDVLRYD